MPSRSSVTRSERTPVRWYSAASVSTYRELGVFTRLFERDAFEEGVANLVETIADGPTVALSEAKRLLDRGTSSTFEAALERETAAQGLAVTTDDHAEGTAAFIEQRDPEFSGQ